MHGCQDQSSDGCGERCYHNLWTLITGCADCLSFADDRALLAQGHSDNDGACNRLIGVIKREMERLAADGMQEGYNWSAIVSPFTWTSMVCTTTPNALAFVRTWCLLEVRREFQHALSRLDVRTPMQLIGWLKKSELGYSQT